MEKGVEHFGRLLKRAFELPVSGMTISLIFSASHAHVEGAGQLRRWGKAENTVAKLKELAEYVDANAVPFAIATVRDRLHMWWREKKAMLHSRQARARRCWPPLEC
jgi:hypothetical protein